MKAKKGRLSPARLAVIIAAAGVLPLAAQAQSSSSSDLQARYQSDLQRCATLSDPEAQRTCRREAGAALQEARRNRLATPADTSANVSARCARLPAAQRADCERLMSDSSAVEHGSVSGGGVLRELTITIPADQAAPAGSYSTQPAPAPAPAQSYGAQPVPGSYNQPAPGSYGQPAPAQPSGAHGQPAPAQPSGAYGTVPAR